jgi:hypothetical protein
LSRGKKADAAKLLREFNDKVRDLVRKNKLAAAAGNLLISEASAVIASLT